MSSLDGPVGMDVKLPSQHPGPRYCMGRRTWRVQPCSLGPQVLGCCGLKSQSPCLLRWSRVVFARNIRSDFCGWRVSLHTSHSWSCYLPMLLLTQLLWVCLLFMAKMENQTFYHSKWVWRVNSGNVVNTDREYSWKYLFFSVLFLKFFIFSACLQGLALFWKSFHTYCIHLPPTDAAFLFFPVVFIDLTWKSPWIERALPLLCIQNTKKYK